MEEIKNTIWERVLEIAQKSPCKKRKVGCLIVNATGEFVSLGYNHNTDWGVEHCENDDDETLDSVIHAEDMAYQEIPDHIKGTELYAYVSHEPCKACRQILNTVCREVFVKNLSPKWPDAATKTVHEDALQPLYPADSTEALLDTRRGTHGDFGLSSDFVQVFKNHARKAPNWKEMNSAEHEAIDMIVHKLGRWLFGTSIDDHNEDICGYSQLAIKHR